MNSKNKLFYFFLSFSLFSFANFYLSNLISSKLQSGLELRTPIINLVFAKNTGAAFSTFQDYTIILIVISLFALLAMLFYVFKNLEEISTKSIFFLSVLMSGILGNLFERIFFGFVRDFFELSFINFPIFNISDIFINLGVFGIIIMLLLSKKPIRIL